MRVLGISAFYHDSAAALIEDGRIIAAAQEERFSRKKHDSEFPKNAILYCLEEAGIDLKDVDYVTFYDKPFLKFERLIETYLSFVPKGFRSFSKAIPVWIKEKLFLKKILLDDLADLDPTFPGSEKLLFSEHHLSHAASAFFPSPFDEAIVLTMDGVGEWATTSVAIGRDNKMEIVKEIHFPHSLGLLYSAFTYYTGFKVNSGEYKLMGLAPYGEPKYTDIIKKHLIHIKEDGSFRLDQKYFDYSTGLRMTNNSFSELFGEPPRTPEQKLTQFHMDIAASIQAVTEEVILKITRALKSEYRISNLCLAGGVALNCVANGKVLKDGGFDSIWVQPAAGDAGGALGAAMSANYVHLGQKRPALEGRDHMDGSYLGPEFAKADVQDRLQSLGAVFTTLDEEAIVSATAEALANDKAVGWMNGRMEFGPRALGGRSILANPMSKDMQKILNLKVKYRESFRPFAPSVLREHVSEWFDLDDDSPYMLLVSDVKADKRLPSAEADSALFGIEKLNVARSTIPAVTHVDFSARIQTVHEDTNPRYYKLLSQFHQKTGCPILVNTSFNVRGEPLVCTPEDAYRCFMGTELDVLVIGDCLLYKEQQPDSLKVDYKNKFELD